MRRRQYAPKPAQDTSVLSSEKLLQTRPFQPEIDNNLQVPSMQASVQTMTGGWDLTKMEYLDEPPRPETVGPLLQAKLTIGQPNDKYEQEADRVAKQVVQRLSSGREGRSFSGKDEPTQYDQTLQRSMLANTVQRKILYNNKFYTETDETDFQKIREENKLPEVKELKLKLKSPFIFVLNSEGTEWIKDTELQFKRYKGIEKLGERNVEASTVTGFSDVGYEYELTGEDGSTRIRTGPKNPAPKTVEKITIVKNSLLHNGHWSLQCEVIGGKNPKGMKIDLTSEAYRILYGATQNSPELTKVNFTLKHPVAINSIYSTFVDIAKEKGRWTGNKQYNCQDFALDMLNRLQVEEEQTLAEQADWRKQSKLND